MKNWTWLALLVCALVPRVASAQGQLSLTFDEAIAMAVDGEIFEQRNASQLAIARAHVSEARNETAYNPNIEVAAGPRLGSADGVDFEVGVERQFAIGGLRRAQLALAEKGAEVVARDVDDARRRRAARAAMAYLQVLHAERRLEIATESTALAERVAEISKQRLDAGEIGRLQANTARLTLGRTRVQVVTWESRVGERLGDLRAVLGLDPTVELELVSELAIPDLPALDALIQQADDRPDLAAGRAAQQQEQLRAELASAMAWPELSLGARYAREEEANIIMGVISVSLPIFARGQAVRELAEAQGVHAAAEFEILRREVHAQLAAAHTNVASLHAAEEAFRNEILPTLDENEMMVRRAYEAGAVDLPDVLAMRSEMIGAREAYADLLLELALSTTNVRAIAGMLSKPATTTEKGD